MMYDQMGGQPSASAFTWPGMDPQQLAMLMRMQGGAPGMMGPPGGMPGMPQGAGGMPPGAPQATPPGSQGAPGAAGIAPLLQMLMANPELLKKLLATFGGAAQGGGGMPMPGGMPGGMPGMPPGAMMPR